MIESDGIGGPPGRRTIYGIGGAVKTAPADQAIDWNGNTTIDSNGIIADVNFIKKISMCDTASLGETLIGHDDWHSLLYDVKKTGTDFADGSHVTAAQAQELTYDQATLIAQADYDSDGIPNSGDNCPVVVNPNQEDQDANGTGDTCDQIQVYLPLVHR